MGQPQRPIAAEQHIISLGRVLQSLREEDDVDVLIETIISFVNEQFDYKMIWVALYDRLNHILIGKGGVAPSGNNNFLNQRLVLRSLARTGSKAPNSRDDYLTNSV